MIDTEIEKIKKEFEADRADLGSLEQLHQLRVKYLGRRQGKMTLVLAKLPAMSSEDKKKFGPILNQFKRYIETELQRAEHALATNSVQLDFNYPSELQPIGHLHPVSQAQAELEDIFRSLGFAVAYGPEIETDWYNFSALNIPESHPARDMWDTFYIKDKAERASGNLLLRTHTSPMQIRFMKKHKPPFAVIIPGTCYRHEATDASHEHTFQQIEGLAVAKDITFTNMMWTLEFALRKFFGSEVKTKLRPSYFPFVEPGAEVAISSPKFNNGQWVELLGCGMVNQKVFEAAGYPKNTYQGFAFGFGLSRFALMKYGVPDIRLFSENKMSFLNQF